jgi:hypothetical protein
MKIHSMPVSELVCDFLLASMGFLATGFLATVLRGCLGDGPLMVSWQRSPSHLGEFPDHSVGNNQQDSYDFSNGKPMTIAAT